MYIHHFTPGKPTGKEQPALKSSQLVKRSWSGCYTLNGWWRLHEYQHRVLACYGCVITYLEKLLEHKLHWIIFQIHVNVLVTFEAFDN